jgi:hypothetical protein
MSVAQQVCVGCCAAGRTHHIVELNAILKAEFLKLVISWWGKMLQICRGARHAQS